MDSDIYAFGAPSNGHSHYKPPGSFYEPPPATPARLGSMNYSPRHSHKPASLSNSRNINMKHLSLNISPTNINSSPAKMTRPPALSIPSSESTPTRSGRKSLEGQEPRLNGTKATNLSVTNGCKSNGSNGSKPNGSMTSANGSMTSANGSMTSANGSMTSANGSMTSANGSMTSANGSNGSSKSTMSPPSLPPWRSGNSAKNQDRLQSPFGPSSLQYTPEVSVTERLGAVDLIDDSEITKPGIFPEDHLNRQSYSKRSRHFSEPYSGPVSQQLDYKVDKTESGPDRRAASLSSPSKSTNPDSFHHESYTFTIPEELQESSMVYAYPDGPANALNSTLYLFSDPHTSDVKIDINDYDLVINVAKECVDLSDTFDDKNGQKQYLWVPWSHTSKISQDLPEITRLMAAMDQPGKKILVHCQCGVSRSACVVVAYFMTKFRLSVNEAYELLKSGTHNSPHSFVQQVSSLGNYVAACDRICPNMSLIFELMDFGEKLKE